MTCRCCSLNRFSCCIAHRCLALFVMFLFAMAASVTLSAQATEGTILGTVTDASGAKIVGATVRIASMETGSIRTTRTNEAGEYVVTNLSLGSYTATVEATGFKKALHPAVTITVKARIRVDMMLQIGEVTETVEVGSQAPLIKTDTAEVGGVVSREILKEVPIFGRNLFALAALVPGTTNGPSSSRQRDFSNSAVTVNGASAEANNFILDGISDNMEFSGAVGVTPAVDAVQEFAIQTSQYSAEFGRAGGGVINVAIKSGTNDVHGFAYDYFRNDKLDARAYDFTGTNPDKQPLRRNQFGAGVGLPVIKNRLFLFGNYEGTRFPSSSLATAIVPTALEKQGNFSQSGFNIFDPDKQHADPSNPGKYLRDQFPGNIIPTSRLDPIGLKLLSYFPDPNYTDPNPNVRNNYITQQRNQDDLDSFNVKTDFNVSPANTLMGRYSQQRGGRIREGWLPNQVLGANGALDASNAAFTYTKILSPSMVNEVRIGYNYLRFGNEMLNNESILGQFNIPGYNILPFADGMPTLNVRNITGPTISRPIASIPTPFLLVEHAWQYMDNLSWYVGNHALKIGGEYARVANNRFQGRNGGGTWGFTGNYTTAGVGQALETLRTGTPDLLLGLANSALTQYAFDAVRMRTQRLSFFAQDDWRITPQLTLNLGLRWEYFGPYHEEQNRFANFNPQTGIRVVPESTRSIIQNTLGLPGGDLPSGWEYGSLGKVIPQSNWRDFSPRFGFAYALSDRLVIRGGYGIFYGVSVGNFANNQGTEGNPFFYDFSLPSELDRPIIARDGFPAGGAAAPLAARTFSAYYGPLKFHSPYSQKWSFNVQVSPFRTTSVEIGYTGQRALHFWTLVPGNTPPPGPGTIQDRRPWPNIGFFYQYVPVNDSNYNGLEITVRQKEFYGIAIQSAFTFSKALGFSTGSDGASQVNDPYNLGYDYGPLPYDFRKRWVTSFIYRVPFWNDAPVLTRHLFSNWQASGLVTLQQGFPFSVGVSGQVMNNGAGSNRADVLKDPKLSNPTRERWFDTTAFGVPAIYQWGAQGKGILRTPGLAVVDFALQKSIPVPITEASRIAFRAEATNLFNRVQLGAPDATLGSPNFGVIRSLQAGPRNIQLVLRLDF